MKTVALAVTAPAAPQSQIKAMSGVTVAVKAPQSACATFVNGDIKGGEAAHNYRMSVIESAIQEAYKGNSRALIEARTFADGKSKKAKAYAAGFDAVGIPARVQYKGKLDSADNAEARAAIMRGVSASAFDFEAAFLTVMQAKPEPKAKKAPAPAPAPEATASASDETSAADTEAPAAEPAQTVTSIMEAAASAIIGGVALADEVEAIRAAIMAYDEARIDAAGVDAGAAILAAMEAMPA